MTSPAIATTDATNESLLETLHAARRLIDKAKDTLPARPTDAHPVMQIAVLLNRAIEVMTKPNPDDRGYFWWLIAVGFAPNLIADGVDFTDRRAQRIFERTFPFARGSEIKAKIIGRPDDAVIAREQGYENAVEAYRRNRDER